MGGHALDKLGITVDRIKTSEYSDTAVEVINKLESTFKFNRDLLSSDSSSIMYFIPCYNKEKTTHGDIDIIVSTMGDGSIVEAAIKHAFKQHVQNGNIFSVAYTTGENRYAETYQIDFILVKNDRAYIKGLFQHVYMSGGNAGNILGKLVNHYDLSFTHEGLFYVVKQKHAAVRFNIEMNDTDKNIIIKKIPILTIDNINTRNTAINKTNYRAELDTAFHLFNSKKLPFNLFEVACPIKNYITSIDTIITSDEYSQSVIDSPWFDYKAFSADTFNHVDRVRIAKRNSYEYVTNNMGTKVSTKTKSELFANLNEVRALYTITTSKLETDIDNCLNEWNETRLLNLEFKSKFNGEIVQSLTGYSGKELGTFMQDLIDAMTVNYNTKLTKTKLSKLDHDEIRNLILNFKQYTESSKFNFEFKIKLHSL